MKYLTYVLIAVLILIALATIAGAYLKITHNRYSDIVLTIGIYLYVVLVTGALFVLFRSLLKKKRGK